MDILVKKSSLLLSLFMVLSTLFVPPLNAYIYFSNVNFPWLLSDLIRTNSISHSAEQIVTAKILMSITMITAFVITLMVVVFWYLYLRHLLEKRGIGLSRDDIADYVGLSFIGSAISAWITFFLLLIKDESQTRLNEFKIFSVNSLLLNLDADSKWYNMATSIDVMSLLGFAALFFLFDKYCKEGILVTFSLAILPDAVFYGLWSIYLCFKPA